MVQHVEKKKNMQLSLCTRAHTRARTHTISLAVKRTDAASDCDGVVPDSSCFLFGDEGEPGEPEDKPAGC